METRLYQASLSGDVASLSELIKEDELVLDRTSVSWLNETPLHIAVMRGHLDFTRFLLSLKPKLALELDSQGCSPLHLASAEGYVDIVRELLRVGPDMCLARDQDGRTPLHLAVMKGRLDVITELIRIRPQVTRERFDHGETLLHLCVKHNQVDALRLLVDSVSDVDLVNAPDDEGNTVLHLAVANKQVETTRYLLARVGVKVNSLSRNGFTAMDVIEHCPRDLKSMEIRELLRDAAALRGNNTSHAAMAASPHREIVTQADNSESLSQQVEEMNSKPDEGWSGQRRAALMVSATLVAVVAFLAGINPPGGVFQDSDGSNQRAGISIASLNSGGSYQMFLISNSVALVASLSIILVVMSGSTRQRWFCNWVLTAAMWIAIFFMAFAYLFSINATLPGEPTSDIMFAFLIPTLLILAIIGVFFLVHVIRLVLRLVRVKRGRRAASANQNEEKV